MLSKKYFYSLFLVLVLAMAACANQPIQRTGQSNDSSNVADVDLEKTVEESEENLSLANLKPAVRSLIVQAESYHQSGEKQQALATLERALRISPYSPQVHYYLAKYQLDQKQAQLALQLAKKGQSLLGANDGSWRDAFSTLLGEVYGEIGR